MAHPSFSTRHPHTGTGGNDPQYSWDPRWGWFQVPTNYTRLYSMSHQHPERRAFHQSSSSMKGRSGRTGQHRPIPISQMHGDRTRESEHPTGGYATPPTTPEIPSRRSRNHAGSSHESQEEAGTKAGRSSDRSRDTQEADHVPDDDSETWPSQAPLDREIRNRQNYAQGYRPNFWISAERIQQVVIDDSLWFWLQKSEYGVWNPNHATFLASQPIPVSPPDADYIKRKCIFCEEQKRDVRYFVPICYMQETVKRSRGMPSRVIEEWVVTREPVNNKVACQVCYQQVKVWKAAFLVMRIAAEAR